MPLPSFAILILEKSMATRAWIHMLIEDEVAEFVKAVMSGDLRALLRPIYKADDRMRFCHGVYDEVIKPIIEKREVLRIPPPDTVGEALMSA
jgi:hypothetical protein